MLMVAFTNVSAGEFCNDVALMCPGPECFAHQVRCQAEREAEARVRDYEKAVETRRDERAKAELEAEARVRDYEKAVAKRRDERAKIELDLQIKSKSEKSRPPLSAPDVAAANKVNDKSTQQRPQSVTDTGSKLPGNAKWNAPPMLGWSCKVGYDQVGRNCIKSQ